MNKFSFLNKLLVVLALAATMLVATPATAEETAAEDPDQAITAKVEAVLKADGKLEMTSPITVSTKDGVVKLSGTVKTVAMVYRVIELARKVDGVKEVNDGALQARAW